MSRYAGGEDRRAACNRTLGQHASAGGADLLRERLAAGVGAEARDAKHLTVWQLGLVALPPLLFDGGELRDIVVGEQHALQWLAVGQA